MNNQEIEDRQSIFAPLLNVLQTIGPVPGIDQPLIRDAFVVRKVKGNEILLRSGSIARELFFIASGILKITSINGKGNHVTQFFLKENQFCSILSSLNGNIPAEESIVCACDCVLLVIKKTKLLALYKQLPYFEQLIKHITTQTLLGKIQTRNAYLGEDASTRYKKFSRILLYAFPWLISLPIWASHNSP